MHEIHPDLSRMFFSSRKPWKTHSAKYEAQLVLHRIKNRHRQVLPGKLACPIKINGWKMKCSFKMIDSHRGNMSNENIAKEVITFGGFLKWWYPQIIHFNRVFHYFHHPFWGTPIFGNIHFVTRLCNDDPWNL